ncbi:quinoprotein relay system zinc metallohydrolase 2 [Hyphomicrobium methylovorum]|uniref:quinoprotein relay system zinc metallohydrolase 2 n=1 Tax=Hyphomicrobium methylovorum TaxID=84 RepID=UPI0015E73683|nr:quinoprotein relay system zinc metallohydrolase 2 [Hyphomicrobium methylovorum]MBA2124635.1 quinoprotein relay system zinc metallohydrolase 2 [Hyphomicrobium methylovorum]
MPISSIRLTRQAVLRGLAATAALPLLSNRRGALAAQSLSEIAPGVFVHVGEYALPDADNGGDISNMSAVVGDTAVAVIDTGGSYAIGKHFLTALKGLTDKPVRYVINTHMHPDHVLGNAAFEGADVTFIGHHKLPAALAARADTYMRRARENLSESEFEGTKIVLPTRTVADTLDLDLGGRTLKLTARPTAHTDNDLTVLDTTTGTFFPGDLLFCEHVPSLDGSLVGWLKLIPILMQEPAVRAVPGHGPKSVTWPDAIKPEQHYLETIAADVRAQLKAGKSLEDALATAGQSEKGNWKLFSDYNGMNVTAAFTELEWE